MTNSLTLILMNAPGSGSGFLNDAFTAAYQDLRRLAGNLLRFDGDRRALPATELVHESYLKIAHNPERKFESRGHFFAVAAKAMKQVILDCGRKRMTAKRGRGAASVELDERTMGGESGHQVEFELALQALHRHSARQAMVFEMVALAGITADEAAITLGVSRPTVSRELTAARAWLAARIYGASK